MQIMGYVRVSTHEQVNEGMSLEAQEARIHAWAQANDAEVTEIIRDEAVSGSKLLQDRPGGKTVARLLEARRPGVDAVVVVRMDRLGRDAAEQISLLKRFRTGRVGVVAIAQHIDLATPHGRAMAQIGAVFAELERALIAERTTETLAEMRAAGRVYNHAPFGWNAEGDFLVPNQAEQATLARLVQLRQQGLGYHKVADLLNQEGHQTKKGGPWQAMTVRNLFLRATEDAA
jgi:DNA invertase Pin-like site-specific DNA recombinase